MAQLNLTQKLYQLVVSRLDGHKITSRDYQTQILKLTRKGIGGFILFGGKKDNVKEFISTIQAVSDIPLFIASDVERGVGQQIDGATGFPSQMALAAAIDKNNSDDILLLKEAIAAISDEAADVGINMPLIPVLDVNVNPDNPIICTRAFSDSPETVSWFGQEYIRILEDKGLISCAKHFPGHGGTPVDSHISLPVISTSREDMMSTDILPFTQAAESGVSSIMVGHLSIPAFDSLPASLSGHIITDLLRDELGYQGLVLTDALNMHALNDIANVPSKCINAGADILLHPADADSTVEELGKAVASGEVDEAKIDTAVERIFTYKAEFHTIQRPAVNYSVHADLSDLLSDRTITLVKDSGGILPIRHIHDTALYFSADKNRHDVSMLKDFISPLIDVADCKGGTLKERVVISLFTRVEAWQGSSGIHPDEIRTVRGIIDSAHKSVVISFGSPYVLRHFNEADVLIAAYDASPQAQRSVIKCLTGEIKCRGTLPVRISRF